MKCLTLLGLLVLATLAYVEAREVNKDKCIYCNEQPITRKYSDKTTTKPRSRSSPTHKSFDPSDDLSGKPLKHSVVAAQKAGKVSINKLFTTTTIKPRKPSPPQGHGGMTTAKPRSKNNNLSGLSLQQTVGGTQKDIKDKCIHCNKLFTTTTTPRKPSPPQGPDHRTTAKPRRKTSSAPKNSDLFKDDL